MTGLGKPIFPDQNVWMVAGRLGTCLIFPGHLSGDQQPVRHVPNPHGPPQDSLPA